MIDPKDENAVLKALIADIEEDLAEKQEELNNYQVQLAKLRIISEFCKDEEARLDDDEKDDLEVSLPAQIEGLQKHIKRQEARLIRLYGRVS